MIQIPLGRKSSSCRNYPQEITPHLICKASIVCCKHFQPAGRTLCSLDVRNHHSQVGFALFPHPISLVELHAQVFPQGSVPTQV